MLKKVKRLQMKYKMCKFLKKNLYWNSYVSYIDGWIPKFAFFVPIIGYLILFNDAVIDLINLEEITSSEDDSGTTLLRLRFVYFGLIFLGVSNIIYKIVKPYTLSFAKNQHEYVREGMSNFSFLDFQEIYENAKKDQAEDDLEEWEQFKKDFEKTSNIRRIPTSFAIKEPKKLWSELKAQHEDFLINLLSMGFCYFNNQRSLLLFLCLVLSTAGYAFLALPSFLVFVEIIQSLL